MKQWATDWRRTGITIMTVGFVAAITWVSASQTFVTSSNGRVVHPSPYTWVLWTCLFVIAVGGYMALSTFNNKLPMVGKSEASNPHIKLSSLHELVGANVMGNGLWFNGQSILYVVVENEGPTGSFSASFSNVSGVETKAPNLVIENYFGKVAWEDVASDQQVIGYRSKARLMAMFIFKEPRAAWFEVPYSAAWSISEPRQLKGWTLWPLENFIVFTLTVVNETDMKSTTRKVAVQLHSDGSIANVDLVAPVGP